MMLEALDTKTILALVFAGGGAWVLIQRMRKDTNGLGTRVRGLEKQMDKLVTVLKTSDADKLKENVQTALKE